MTFKQILDEIRILANDLNEKKYPRLLLEQWVNEAQNDISLKTKAFRGKDTSITTTSGIQEYNIPASVIDIDRDGGVTWYESNGNERLDFVSINYLDKYFDGWRTAGSGTPERCYSYSGKIGLSPKPNDAQTLTIYCYKYATVLSANADVPFNALPQFTNYHVMLVYYALYMIGLLEKNDNLKAYYNLYTMKMEEFKETANYHDDMEVGLQPHIGFPDIPLR
jgi:hypothetical protein